MSTYCTTYALIVELLTFAHVQINVMLPYHRETAIGCLWPEHVHDLHVPWGLFITSCTQPRA